MGGALGINQLKAEKQQQRLHRIVEGSIKEIAKHKLGGSDVNTLICVL